MSNRTGTKNWNVLIFAAGTGGDVYPPITLGKQLRERGHRVLFVSSPFFEPVAKRAGLDFVGRGTAEEYLATIQNPDIWQLGKGMRIFFDFLLWAMRDVYEIIAERYTPGESLVIAPWYALGARLANEKLGVPLVQLHVGTTGLRSLNDLRGVVFPGYLKPVMRPLRRLFVAGLDRRVLDPLLAPRLNAFRAELGLPPVSRVLNQWIYSPQLVIGLFPDWFVAPQPDWPPNTHLTGFVLSDQAESKESSPELARFLDSGDLPIIFTWGTGMCLVRRLFEASVEVCRLMGRRGLFLTPFHEQVPADLPETVRHFDYVPFSKVLPRAAALVHHGGIGTMAHAFAAGIPQLVTPLHTDQPSNARRLRRLGAGDSISPQSYEPRRVAAKLETLVSSQAVAQKCRQLKLKMQRADASAETCELIEATMAPLLQRAAHQSSLEINPVKA